MTTKRHNLNFTNALQRATYDQKNSGGALETSLISFNENVKKNSYCNCAKTEKIFFQTNSVFVPFGILILPMC